MIPNRSRLLWAFRHRGALGLSDAAHIMRLSRDAALAALEELEQERIIQRCPNGFGWRLQQRRQVVV